MTAQRPDAGRQPVVVGEHRAAVAVTAQYLGGKERRAPDLPDRTRITARAVGHAAYGSQRLGVVLDHLQAVLLRNGRERSHIARLPEQMDGDDDTGTLRHQPGDARRVDIESAGIDVGEDRNAAQQQHRFGHGRECEGRDDDFVAPLQPHGQQ